MVNSTSTTIESTPVTRTMPLTQQNIRGVKRRRPDDKGSEEDKEAKLRRKLHHALRELRKVVKKTRTFEVQKTLKKLKEARRKDPEGDVTMDLGAQLEVLKHLNYDQLANSALMTKLKKDKTLFADPSIQAISLELPSNLVSPGMPGTSTAKVQSRILSSKVLASEVVSIVETLRTFLHPSAGSEDIGETTDNPHASPDISKRRKTGHEKDAFLSKDNVANPSGEWGDGGYENTSGDEAVIEMDDGWESGTLGAPSGLASADDHDPSSDDSNDVTFGQDSSDESGFLSENPKSSRSQPHGPKGQSEFLPSLSVGFARGDSGSDLSDSETKFVDGIKKNRRGQRARRAIWEKKFGKNANHVKKRQQQKTVHGSKHHLPDSVRVDRRSGKANSSLRSHRAPTQSRAPTHDRQRVRRPSPGGSEGVKNYGSTKGQSERTRCEGDLRENQGERPLHPSWEAKRKQQAVSIMPSQGTKIVFSES